MIKTQTTCSKPSKFVKANQQHAMTTLEQQFGVNAVGAMVAREFGGGIIYHGTITSFKRWKDGESDLCRVEYDDGDAKDMDRD